MIKKVTKKTKSKVTKKRKLLHFWGYEFYEDDYVNGAPTVMNHLMEHFNKAGITLKYPLSTRDKGKYWECKNLYPTSKADFIDKFFKKRTPKVIEGIYENKLIGKIGLVRENSYYQMYNIDIWFRDKVQLNFFERLTEDNYEIDYSITSGSKVGALIPTSDKSIYKFDGISTLIMNNTGKEIDIQPCNLLVSLDVTISHEGNLYLELFPPNPGFNYKRIWPNQPINLEEDNTNTKNKDIKNSGLPAGTGFFVDNSGHVLTNYHVVEPCNNKTKIIYKNKEYKAKLIAKDKNLDLAVLKVNIKNDYFIKTFDKPIKKLQSIIAAGYPLSGILGNDLKYTSGIISSLKGMYDDTTQIQIDAALNPGNSGGPIVDKISGELVAVAVSVAARRDVLEGINFGIKVSQVKDFLYANGVKEKTKKNKSKDTSKILENSTVQIICQ
jgi:S1-C subfamily serine protease